MDILVLSCGTGGGHNSAGCAIAEEMRHRGHNVSMQDTYKLVGERASELLNGTYVNIARNAPRLFGCIYALGEACDKLPLDSPVYRINSRFSDKLGSFLLMHHFDAVIVSHMFAAHMLKSLKTKGVTVPKSVFVATDYTCSPFTGESDCELYAIPHESLADEFVSQGIDGSRIRAFGIPVCGDFSTAYKKSCVRECLEMNNDAFYYLVAGGSMGAGCVSDTLEVLCGMPESEQRTEVVAVCGSNRKLYEELRSKYRNDSRIRILEKTNQMANYMKAADVFITKPGGLSSTEAAVVGIPLIHISPIPGCETRNAEFFRTNGMSLYSRSPKKDLKAAVRTITERKVADILIANQRKYINPNAASDICDYIENEL